MEQNRAQWLINPDGWYPYCSNCRHEPNYGSMSEYCPNCGSHMTIKSQHSTVVLDIQAQEKIDDLIADSLINLTAMPKSYYNELTRHNLTKIREILEANK